MRHLAFIIIVTLSLFSCGEPPITFDQPQPADVKSLDHFPARMQGRYQSMTEPSVLTITDTRLIKWLAIDYSKTFHINDVDSSMRLAVGDSIVDTLAPSITRRVGDSIIFSYQTEYLDTIFEISEHQVLKKFKGHYFLNRFVNEGEWAVDQMELSKGKLSIHSIGSKEDLMLLKEITESKDDTISTHFSLSKKQFRKFTKESELDSSEVFVKVRD